VSQVSYSRQSEFVDADQARGTHVSVLGLGTVGSHAAVELARLGIGSLYVVDGDAVEPENLPSQAYNLTDVGRTKVEACAERVQNVSDHVQVTAEQKMLAGGEVFRPGPVVLAVDSMQARKAILELSVAHRPSHSLLIDARMAGRTLQLYAFNPCENAALERWQAEWFDDSVALQVPCGGRSVSYIGATVGGLIASYVQRHLKGEPLPFFCQLDLATLTLVQVRAA
jgi:molybdopterin/thiamine biosynthesis adenylyltransferase